MPPTKTASFDFDEDSMPTRRAAGPGVTGNAPSIGRIDHYEILRKLGGGGFGVVYLARDTASDVEVAIKTIHPVLKHDEEGMDTLRSKFALVSRLSHPNIATALVLHPAREIEIRDDAARRDLRLSPGDSVMVMRYAPGVTLSRWRLQFPDGIVPPALAVEIGRQVAAALDYAHGERIVHRDIKPSNIMVETLQQGSSPSSVESLKSESRKSGPSTLDLGPSTKVRVRILDFGLAAEIRSSMSRFSTASGDTSGTRPYMAPEQWVGRKQNGATDQYALACVLYELLGGVPPFSGVFETGDLGIMMMAVESRPPSPVDGLPDAANEVLARALAKTPEGRFQSCSAFCEALASAFADPGASPIKEAATSTLSVPSKGAAHTRRWRMPLAIIASLAAIAAAAVAIRSRATDYYPPQPKPSEGILQQAAALDRLEQFRKTLSHGDGRFTRVLSDIVEIKGRLAPMAGNHVRLIESEYNAFAGEQWFSTEVGNLRKIQSALQQPGIDAEQAASLARKVPELADKLQALAKRRQEPRLSKAEASMRTARSRLDGGGFVDSDFPQSSSQAKEKGVTAGNLRSQGSFDEAEKAYNEAAKLYETAFAQATLNKESRLWKKSFEEISQSARQDAERAAKIAWQEEPFRSRQTAIANGRDSLGKLTQASDPKLEKANKLKAEIKGNADWIVGNDSARKNCKDASEKVDGLRKERDAAEVDRRAKDKDRQANEARDRADKLVSEGKFAEALAKYADAERLAREAIVAAYLDSAEEMKRNARWDGVISFADKAMSIDKSNAKAAGLKQEANRKTIEIRNQKAKSVDEKKAMASQALDDCKKAYGQWQDAAYAGKMRELAGAVKEISGLSGAGDLEKATRLQDKITEICTWMNDHEAQRKSFADREEAANGKKKALARFSDSDLAGLEANVASDSWKIALELCDKGNYGEAVKKGDEAILRYQDAIDASEVNRLRNGVGVFDNPVAEYAQWDDPPYVAHMRDYNAAKDRLGKCAGAGDLEKAKEYFAGAKDACIWMRNNADNRKRMAKVRGELSGLLSQIRGDKELADGMRDACSKADQALRSADAAVGKADYVDATTLLEQAVAAIERSLDGVNSSKSDECLAQAREAYRCGRWSESHVLAMKAKEWDKNNKDAVAFFLEVDNLVNPKQGAMHVLSVVDRQNQGAKREFLFSWDEAAGKWVGMDNVTQGQWLAIDKAYQKFMPEGDDKPANRVNGNDIQKWIDVLGKRPECAGWEFGYSLPGNLSQDALNSRSPKSVFVLNARIKDETKE